MYFFQETQILTFWETLLFQSHSTGNLQISAFVSTINFSIKKTFSFWKNPNFESFGEVLLLRSHSTEKLIHLEVFEKIKWWSFREISMFQAISTTNLLLLPFFNIFFFFKKSIIFYEKKNVLKNRNISVAFNDNFAMFSDFEEFMFFLEKLIWFSNKNQFLNVLRIFTISVAFYGKFAKFGTFYLFQNTFSKNPPLFRKTTKLEDFELSYKFNRFVREVFYI